MHRFGFNRPTSVTLTTRHGAFELDLGDALRLQASAGTSPSQAPLVVDGQPFAVLMRFGYSAQSGRFSLVADGNLIIWDPQAPGERPASPLWLKAAKAVEDAVEEFTDTHPEVAILAEAESIEKRIQAIECEIENTVGLHQADLIKERAALSARLVQARRQLMTHVG